jgi:hypothetical protein
MDTKKFGVRPAESPRKSFQSRLLRRIVREVEGPVVEVVGVEAKTILEIRRGLGNLLP